MKKYLIISLSITLLLGSLFTAFASNLFFSDILNGSAGGMTSGLFVSLPAIGIALTFVLVTLYLIRIYEHPNSMKRISRLYLILMMAFNFIGLVGVILSSITVYHTLMSNSPFPGYLIIMMILHILLIGGGVYGLLSLKKLKDDEEHIKINFLYVLKTIGWVLFILLAYNRIGTLLMFPLYVYLRNLYMTFPFYLWLLTPLYLGVLEVLYILGILKGKKLLVLSIVGLGINVILFTYSTIMGMNDSSYIASLSLCMPLERLLSKPIEMPIHLLAYLSVGIVLSLQSRKKEQ